MKVKRNKRHRKFLQFYATSYGIKPPYKVVLDGPYLQAALQGKVKILEQIPKLLQAPTETVVMVTKCCIHDLKQKGDSYRGAVMIGSTLKYARCNHEGIIEPGECMKLLIKGGNPDRLFIGAQEVVLRHFVRATPGVPLLFISGQVPILEPPAESDKKHIVEERTQHTTLSTEEKEALKALKPPKTTVFKRKKVKGPNPLSVKKKKPAQTPQQAVPTQKASALPTEQTTAAVNVITSTSGTPVTTTKKKRTKKRRKASAVSEGNLDHPDVKQADTKVDVKQADTKVDVKQADTKVDARPIQTSVPQTQLSNASTDQNEAGAKPKRKRQRKRTKTGHSLTSGEEEHLPTETVVAPVSDKSSTTPSITSDASGPKRKRNRKSRKAQPT